MKLKRLLTLTALLLASSTFTFAQISANTTIRINLDVNQMQNVDCNLNTGAVTNGKVYMHSGLCTDSQSYCDGQIVAYGGLGWEHIVGNWGLDDGVGLMTNNGSNKWSITFQVYDYYSNNISSGSTAMNAGATPYMIGMVFRDLDGTFEGKDVLCNDIFLRDLQGTPNAINSSDTTQNSAVTMDVITGLDDFEALGGVYAYPNPSNGNIYLEYFLGKALDNIRVSVLNTLGQEVAMLYQGAQPAGTQRITWDGQAKGAQAPAGIYFMTIETDGVRMTTQKVMVTH